MSLLASVPHAFNVKAGFVGRTGGVGAFESKRFIQG